jgi:hypothetical protein
VTQPTLFDLDAPRGAYGQPAARTTTPAPRDPNVRPDDVKRLTGHNAAILARLRRGPAYNHELAAISLKYSGRVSDLRVHGIEIAAERFDGGTWSYTLVRDNPAVRVEGGA